MVWETGEYSLKSENDLIMLDGSSLTFNQVLAAAYGRPGYPKVALSEAAKVKVNRAAEAVNTLLVNGTIAYGITTGFGAFKDHIIEAQQVEQLQHNIILSHAVGVGDPFDTATTRAIMLIRANTLSRGFSGIRLSTLQLLID
jgi:histidine ammonia-lyase